MKRYTDDYLRNDLRLTDEQIAEHREFERQEPERRKREKWIATLEPRERAKERVIDHLRSALKPGNNYLDEEFGLHSQIQLYLRVACGYGFYERTKLDPSKLRLFLGRNFSASSETSQRLQLLIDSAARDYVAYRVCVDVVLELIEARRRLPENLGQFLYDVLHGRLVIPGKSKSGAPHWKNHGRDYAIVRAIEIALFEDKKLRATRNVTSSTTSACDIVADCMRTLKKSGAIANAVAAKTVTTIWQNAMRAATMPTRQV